MKNFIQEFKDFISRGNAIDLAIGLIIGSAFSVVVNSIVDNLIMPPFSLLLRIANFQDLYIVLRHGEHPLPTNATLAQARELGAVTFNYGQFLTDFISFLLLGLGVFLIVKGINRLNKKMNEIKEKVTKEEENKEEEEQEKDCPFCLQSIPLKSILHLTPKNRGRG